jgi:hypothetical protein
MFSWPPLNFELFSQKWKVVFNLNGKWIPNKYIKSMKPTKFTSIKKRNQSQQAEIKLTPPPPQFFFDFTAYAMPAA